MTKVFCKPTQSQLQTVKHLLDYYGRKCIKDMRYLYFNTDGTIQANAMGAPMSYTEVTFDEFITINF